MSVTNTPKVVMLRVGERTFHTTAETLTERSDYFKAYFSGKWTIPTMEDGSIFIDADGEAFEHVLRYLRRGVFPLAFDAAKGHNYHLYTSILEEAIYFQCHHLVTWLKDQCYHKSVTWHTSIKEVEGETIAVTGDGSARAMSIVRAEHNFNSEWMTDDGAAFVKYANEKEMHGLL
ncbi:hypothetical protein A7C99_1767 [Trichophyton rubrum]|uniref:BTB domain-containing protein n=1 Tax=Trichophyton rubrum TaxID=5551 RepID=A0A178F262_TRIRU|nr:hypothetical protein A7C99_1767 [Trichophyton rubrum]